MEAYLLLLALGLAAFLVLILLGLLIWLGLFAKNTTKFEEKLYGLFSKKKAVEEEEEDDEL